MSDDVPRFPNGDRKFPSHIELERQGWVRGDYPARLCKVCGQLCEWWGRAPIGSGDWTFFEARTTNDHGKTCKLR
jgi:hypothetical protein